jgi:hypothetical protein
MTASCDPKVRFWINAKQLQDPSLWQAGWLSLNELDGRSGNSIRE